MTRQEFDDLVDRLGREPDSPCVRLRLAMAAMRFALAEGARTMPGTEGRLGCLVMGPAGDGRVELTLDAESFLVDLEIVLALFDERRKAVPE